MDEIETFMNSKSMNNKGKLKQSKGDYKPCQLPAKRDSNWERWNIW